MRRIPPLPLLLVLLGMVASAALFATTLAWLHPMAYGRPVAWHVPFAVNLAFLVVWAALVPIVVFFARHLPAGEGHWKKTIPAQLGLGVVLSITHLVLVEIVIRALHIRRPGDLGELDFMGTVAFSVAVNLQASMALYWTLTGLAY